MKRKTLRKLTRQVLRNNRVRARIAAKPKAVGAIRHVIYVIKENRTYDQVLGNLGKGDGDPALTLFDEESAPNHRALARRFTLFDNFFSDAQVSADGISWTMSAGVSDYIDKTWPITYSPGARKRHRARDFEQVSYAEQFLTEPLAFDQTIFRGAAALSRGYLWDNAYRDGVSYRDYGMYTTIPADCDGTGNISQVTHLDDSRFGDHVDERYPGFNLDCSDHRDREPEWEREFSRVRERVPGRPVARPAARALDRAAAERPHLRHDAGQGASPRPTSPTTTSRWGGWCRRSRTARSGPTPRSWSPRTTPRTGPTTSTRTAPWRT